MTVPPLLTLADIRLTFGGDALFESADLNVGPGARIALVGRNGAGKSTLLKIAAGWVEPDAGERFLQPGVSVSYLPQEPDLTRYPTAIECVSSDLPASVDVHGARLLLEELGVAPDRATTDLSGGEAKRIALAQVIAKSPDILLLDEPTNHLDVAAITWLEDRLAAMRASLVVISHDRRFLETLTNETVWIDRGYTRTAGLGFAKFESWRDKFLEEEKTARHKLGRKIVAEEDWMRYGVTARRKRNMRRVRELKAMRKELREARRTPGVATMKATAAAASGKRVIKAEKISKSFGARPIIKDFSIEIARGERIGVVGPNGAGKTTLLRLLTGDLTPDDGRVSLGTNLEIVSLDQRRASLKPEMRLADAITDSRGDWVTVGETKKHVAAYLKDFLFAPEQWRSPVEALSGGERGRLALAAALAKPSNLLVLDEPTNDLDLETLDLLEDLLADYAGTLLLVSHDRSFLDRIVTAVITTDPREAGKWRRYAGGYDDMVAQRGAAPGAPPKPAAPQKQTTAAASRPAAKPTSQSAKKLSYKEKYALETLPEQIAELQTQIDALKKRISDPELFQRDAALFNASAKELEALEAKLAAAEDEWLALELKREALEDSGANRD